VRPQFYDHNPIADNSRQIFQKFGRFTAQNFKFCSSYQEKTQQGIPVVETTAMLFARLARFWKDCKGGVAPLLALGAIPLIGSVGAAVDYSRANAARTSMQTALDAAAIMLSKEYVSTEQLSQKASNYFNANFVHADVQNVTVTAGASSISGGSAVTMSAEGSIRTTFMGVMGFSTLNLSVTTAVSATADGLGCVLALDKTASGAVTGQGSTTVVLNGCSLYDNSNNATALTVGGSAKISALSVGVVGGMTGSENITTTQGIKTGAGQVDDPYADYSFPPFFGCSVNNYSANQNETISAGVYCGGITIHAGATVTLNPGIYYLDGGSLTVNGGSTLTGSGVTLVFTKKNKNSWATATINGNATINLTPPKSGPTKGIVMFGDRNMPVDTSFKFNGGASQYIGGAIYLPTAAISFSGGAATGTNCTQIIGDTVTFVGNSSVAINCSGYEIVPFSAKVIRLTS
jgi:Flp pilus assembly protein TadG